LIDVKNVIPGVGDPGYIALVTINLQVPPPRTVDASQTNM